MERRLLLHEFLSKLETVADFTCPTELLDEYLKSSDARRALCEARILVPAGRATWYKCARDLRGCRRTVAVEAADDTRLHLVCGSASHACPIEAWTAPDLPQHALDELALLDLLQRLFGVRGRPIRRDGRGAAWLGRTATGDRDLYALLRPNEPAFSHWMRDLEQLSTHGRSLVLVPTDRHIRADTFDRYGPGQRHELVHLDRALTISGGRIARAEPPPPARASQPSLPATDALRSGIRWRVPPGTRWSQIAFEYVDDDVVAVRIGDRTPVRMSAGDLGLTRRSTGGPSYRWKLLLALCAGEGTATLAAVGADNLAVLRSRAWRLSMSLCDVFAMVDSPLHVEADTRSVRSDFIARSETLRTRSHRKP
jgi:hypothetical protein